MRTLNPPRVLSVSELTSLLKGTLEGRFPRVTVSGEVSNFRRQASGHLYFTLKDEGACLSAMVWRRDALRLPYDLADGLQLICQGRIEVYAPHGKYQLIAERLEPVGAGALALAFEQLKKKLEAEGLFHPSRKRPIPFLPRCIGVVTSPTGAALRDFLRVLRLRFPSLPVLVAPAKVQGEGAAREVVAGIERLSQRAEIDVIVVTRGGGSMEDLWAFNEEVLARAIAGCRVPVVSAVGHEIDFTIADFAADHRAPTPTGAAELLAPVRVELVANLAVASRRLQRGLFSGVQRRREALLRLRFALGDPRREMSDRRLRLADLQDRLHSALKIGNLRRTQELRRLHDRLDRRDPRQDLSERTRRLGALRVALERAAGRALALAPRRLAVEQLRARQARAVRERCQRSGEELRVAHARLEAISPQRVFERGYSMTRRAATGKVVRTVGEVAPGDALEIVVRMREEGGELFEEKISAVAKAL